MRIATIICNHNYGQYLSDAIDSALNQTIKTDIYIADDGSTDNSDEIIQKWLIKDSRFKYINKENEGECMARNDGLEMAMGEWIQFLDADDTISSNKFSESSQFFEDYELIITDFVVFNSKGVYPPFCKISNFKIDIYNIIAYWDKGLNIPIHCALLRMDVIGKLRFNENIISKEDWLFWIELLTKPIKSIFIPKHMAQYRTNPYTLGRDFDLISKANEIIYKNSNDEIKALMFDRLNDFYVEDKKALKIFQDYIDKVHKHWFLSIFFNTRNFIRNLINRK